MSLVPRCVMQGLRGLEPKGRLAPLWVCAGSRVAHLGEDEHSVSFIPQLLEHLLQQHELPRGLDQGAAIVGAIGQYGGLLWTQQSRALADSPSGFGTKETVVMDKCLAMGHLPICTTEPRVQTLSRLHRVGHTEPGSR